MKPAMARVSISLAAVIFSAALFGSVLGQAANSTLMSALGLAPSPAAVPGPESSFGPAPPPGPDCFTILLNLSDCLTYVQPGSNLTKPDKPCCPELSSLVDSSPFCLCKLLGDPESTGFNIDINRALKLPSVCAVSTPPVSLCSVLGVPVSAPMASKGPSAPVLGVPIPAPTAGEGPSAPGGVPLSSVASAPSNPGNRASRSVLSAGVVGAAILVSVFF